MARRAIVLFVLVLSCGAFAQLDEEAASRLFDRLNHERSKAGVPGLQWDGKLAAAAAQHALEMANRKQLSHQFSGEPSPRQRIIATGLRTDASAENVGSAETFQEIHSGWMESAGHRHNLLNPTYNAVGIAVVRRGHTLYAAQDFVHRLVAYSDKEVETIVATQFIRARAQAGLGGIRLANAPDVHAAACGMARDGHMEASALVSKLSHVRAVFTFTTAEPQKLPDALARTAPAATSFAVGSCFGKTDRYPEGTNWVVVAFY